MKLVNKQFANMKLHTTSGEATVDANGEVEIADEATAKSLQESGFRPVFQRKPEAKVEAKIEPKTEPKVEPKADDDAKAKKKG